MQNLFCFSSLCVCSSVCTFAGRSLILRSVSQSPSCLLVFYIDCSFDSSQGLLQCSGLLCKPCWQCSLEAQTTDWLTGGEIIVQQENPGEEGWEGTVRVKEVNMCVCVQSQEKRDPFISEMMEWVCLSSYHIVVVF